MYVLLEPCTETCAPVTGWRVRASTTSPLSLSVLMSPFWQKAQRMLHEVKKTVPEPCVPR